MPYKTIWVEPKLFLRHKGVSIYYTYRDDDVEQPNIYHFTNDPCDPNGFDATDLPNWLDCPQPPYITKETTPRQERKINALWNKWPKVREKHIATVIREAINQGHITVDRARTIHGA